MFRDIIEECRAVIEGKRRRKSRKDLDRARKDLDERPEVSVSGQGLPKRGIEGLKPYGAPGRTTQGGGTGSHGQSSHT